jgi:HB1, ASXL, restriction endonuclease HTH domain
MTDALEAALNANRAGIIAALQDARQDLADLREREREVVRLINRAEMALGLLEPDAEVPAPPSPELTLHEAMSQVLRERGTAMTAREIAEEINRRGLYRKADGSLLDPGQVHARVHRYGHLFERRNRKIELR